MTKQILTKHRISVSTGISELFAVILLGMGTGKSCPPETHLCSSFPLWKVAGDRDLLSQLLLLNSFPGGRAVCMLLIEDTLRRTC